MENTKIDFIDIFILMSMSIFADIIEFLVFLTGIGVFISEYITVAAECMIGLYLFLFKGVMGKNQWATYGAGFISEALTGGALPTKSIALGLNIYLHNKAVGANDSEEGGNAESSEDLHFPPDGSVADNYTEEPITEAA